MSSPLSDTYYYCYRGQDFPTKKFVLRLHDKVLEHSEGRSGVAYVGVIESAVTKPIT